MDNNTVNETQTRVSTLETTTIMANSNNPFEVLRPSTLAAIVADIDANLELTPSDHLVESVREACYQSLADNVGAETADELIAAELREGF